MRNRERERRAQRKRCEQEIRLQMFVLAVGAALLLFLVIVGIGRWREAVAERKRLEAERALLEREEELLSDSVLEYEDLVKYYAEEEGIYEYVPVLLAIMEVETKGERDDVMQSSESAGLEPNSLGPEASIAQACDYFRGLVDRTEDLDVDRNTIIQAYNYGPGYMYYIAENGGEHSFDLAVEYAKEMSGGRTAKYTHDIADFNGNWMYLYGNMYYVLLVEQYLPCDLSKYSGRQMRSGLSGGICRKQGREKWKRSTRAVPLLKSQKIKQGQAGSEKRRSIWRGRPQRTGPRGM